MFKLVVIALLKTILKETKKLADQSEELNAAIADLAVSVNDAMNTMDKLEDLLIAALANPSGPALDQAIAAIRDLKQRLADSVVENSSEIPAAPVESAPEPVVE